MSKAVIIVVAIAFITLIGFISTLSVWNHNLGKENARLKAELANASTLLDVQNKALEKQKLDTEAFASPELCSGEAKARYRSL